MGSTFHTGTYSVAAIITAHATSYEKWLEDGFNQVLYYKHNYYNVV